MMNEQVPAEATVQSEESENTTVEGTNRTRVEGLDLES